MEKVIVSILMLVLLAACQSTPKLEDDTRYVRMATVVEVHEFTEIERQQAKANTPSDTRFGIGFGVGVSSGGGSFSGLSLGIGHRVGERHDRPPQIADGANRITVQLLESGERIEVMSYGQHKNGDCVKVLAGHPTEFPRFFVPKPGERCD